MVTGSGWPSTGSITPKSKPPEDPHSPQIHGIGRVLWAGVFLYVTEARNRDTLERYGHGTPDDWIETPPLCALLVRAAPS